MLPARLEIIHAQQNDLSRTVSLGGSAQSRPELVVVLPGPLKAEPPSGSPQALLAERKRGATDRTGPISGYV
jgi:hypothetical protein